MATQQIVLDIPEKVILAEDLSRGRYRVFPLEAELDDLETC